MYLQCMLQITSDVSAPSSFPFSFPLASNFCFYVCGLSKDGTGTNDNTDGTDSGGPEVVDGELSNGLTGSSGASGGSIISAVLSVV